MDRRGGGAARRLSAAVEVEVMAAAPARPRVGGAASGAEPAPARGFSCWRTPGVLVVVLPPRERFTAAVDVLAHDR